MPGRSFRVARIAGIPIGISPWWLAIVALISWFLGASYYPDAVDGIAPAASYALGLASALLLFVSILAHEVGHAVVARRRGIEVEEIDLWLLGGVAKLRGEATAPEDELRYALAGPAVTAVVVAALTLVALLADVTDSSAAGALLGYQLAVNALILAFNLLPAFPLDGGRVLRALLWRRGGNLARATATAARIGRLFGFALVVLGVLELATGGSVGGLWLMLVGAFLVGSAATQAAVAEFQEVLSGVPAHELMRTPVVSLPADLALDRAVVEYFVPYGSTAFPVADADGRLVGLVALGDVERVAPAERGVRRVAELAQCDAALVLAADDDVAQLLERPAFARVGRAVVVDADRVPIGLVSITDVRRVLRATRLTPRRPQTPRDGSAGGSAPREDAGTRA